MRSVKFPHARDTVALNRDVSGDGSGASAVIQRPSPDDYVVSLSLGRNHPDHYSAQQQLPESAHVFLFGTREYNRQSATLDGAKTDY
jgi:hypothetical protein